jgi:hypothetical protein
LIRWIALFSVLANLLFPGLAVKANNSTELSGVQAQYQFGGILTVQAHYLEAANLQHADLIFQTTSSTPNQFPLQISADGTLSGQEDLASLNLQPFSRVYYWFKLTFTDNTSHTSAAYWFDYSDNRFTWQSNHSKWFSIYWVTGNPDFGNELQNIALSGLKNATQILPVPPNLPISVYVYPDAQSLPATASSEPAWIAGETLPQVNVILVSASTDVNSSQELTRQIPHEIVHILEYQLTQQNYAASPAWLLEGLATNAENSPNPDYARVLQKAFTTKSLIPMNQLCFSFSPDAGEASLAYAQSASFVSYLTSTYSTDKVEQLLTYSGNGMDCSQLVKTVLGISLETADQNWQQSTFTTAARENGIFSYWWPYLILVLLLLVGLVFLRRYLITKRHKENGSQ